MKSNKDTALTPSEHFHKTMKSVDRRGRVSEMKAERDRKEKRDETS